MGKQLLGLGGNIQTKPIEGTNGKYVAGSDGHIYCYSTARNNRQKPYPFQVSESIGSNGYPFIGFILDRKKTMPVHILICTAFHGDKPSPSMSTRHLDGIKLNNKPDNLCWGTYAENEADKRRHGRTALGGRQGIAKLTDEGVRIIRASIPYGLWNTTDAANVFGVTSHHISAIARGRGWKHLQQHQTSGTMVDTPYKVAREINAGEMKILLMCYWRFTRQCPLVAMEFDYGYADVIALSGKGRIIHETEIKMSIADMKADRRKPKHHPRNLFGKDITRNWANYFYFAVPEGIKEKALKVCRELFPYAGLLVVGDYETYLKNNDKPFTSPPITQLRDPQYLQVERISEKRLFRLVKGMSNNLCSNAYQLMLSKRMGTQV